MSLSEFAAAKVNLYLHVVGRRDNGYHLLDSLVVFAGVGDRLSVSSAETLSLSVTGPYAAALAHEADNLVLRAARALAVRASPRATGKLVLEKNLPVASGIGGGSADAAATLRLLCRFWGLERGVAFPLAAGLGADVPVCLASRPALMSGIGDVLAPAPKLPDVGIVLVNPGIGVSTPSVFNARTGPFSNVAYLPEDGWPEADSLVETLRAADNDLEASALHLAPAIGEILRVLRSIPDCLLARMSGSGATCFGLFRSPGAAREAARTIVRDGWWVWGGGLSGNSGSGFT